MTDSGWDERTEAIPGTRDDKSFELDFDLQVQNEASPTAETQPVQRPLIVAFEPAPLGIASTLQRLGYQIVAGNTGVDVMSLVAARTPRMVLCAPAPDAERRRLLSAALRLRFPHIPIVYVSTHAAHEEAVLGALREGARAVLPWPLPSGVEIERVLGPFLRAPTEPTGVAVVGGDSDIDTAPTGQRPAAPRPPASSEGPFEDANTLVTGEEESMPPGRIVPEPKPTKPVPAPVSIFGPGASEGGLDVEPTTQPNLRPAAMAVVEAQQQRRGEIGELLAAVSPFLWSLEDAGRWAAELGEKGDPVARNHGRTLQLLAKILAQLQARIDESGA